MDATFVRAVKGVQNIEENKIYIQPGSFFSKRFNKKRPLKKSQKSIVSETPVPQVVENLPNTKNIKNLNLKSQLKKDVGLAILSAQNIAANKQFNTVEEGYVKRNNNKKSEYTEATDEDRSKDNVLFTNTKNPSEQTVLTQDYIYNKADVGTQKKVFLLNLRLGPYKCSYSRNGKYLLSTGDKGHISLIDVQNYDTLCELEVEETVRCNTILHNHKLFAVGQKKYMYIYDNTGMEVNCIKDILYTYKMEFLPYHFLLVSIGEFGELAYQDISLGTVVTRKKTKRGPCNIMKQNKKNGIIYLGHKNGHVSLWTPNIDKPVCDIFCSYTPISSIGVYDNYLITSSIDTNKIWDIRNQKYIKSFKTPNIVNNIEISDTSVVAFSMNTHFRAYKDFFTSPDLFLKHNTCGNRIASLAFQPFEDICCLGTSTFIQTVIVPGAGIANIDGYLNNPYETKKDVRENEVRALLDKLPPDTITFRENQVGRINPYQHQAMKGQKKKRETKKSDTKEVTQKKSDREKTKKKGKKAKKVKKNTLCSYVPKYLRKSALDRKKEKEQLDDAQHEQE